MTFSQRIGLAKIRDAIQVDSLDSATRNAIWNLISPMFDVSNKYPGSTLKLDIWTDLYQQASDTVPDVKRAYEYNIEDNALFYRFYREKVIKGAWNECLDLVEYLAQENNRSYWSDQCYDMFSGRSAMAIPSAKTYNAIFEQYMVGYRFVNGQITPITSDEEIKAIEDAAANSSKAVQESLSKALTFLSSRTNPDYANSVQSAISAVESQCCILLGKDNVTLGAALKQLESKGIILHSALKESFNKLYGYTSSADGIRHGSINPSEVDQDIAKFMLVACSAFVNYLVAKSA